MCELKDNCVRVFYCVHLCYLMLGTPEDITQPPLSRHPKVYSECAHKHMGSTALDTSTFGMRVNRNEEQSFSFTQRAHLGVGSPARRHFLLERDGAVGSEAKET